MKTYKVVKEFGCAQKGDVLNANEEGFFELVVECNCNDCYSSRSICISADIADTLALAGYLEEFEEEVIDECDCCDRIQEVSNHIDEMIEQYTKDHDELIEQYNEGEVPPCVKVEADTVYFNMVKVLNHIKDLLNE